MGTLLLMLLLVVLGLCTAASSVHALPVPPSPPNVLLIMADDFKPLLDAYVGGKLHRGTPNLDSLARQGTSFMNAHAQMSMCGPSRATILTGLRPDTHQVFGVKQNALFLKMKKETAAAAAKKKTTKKKKPYLLIPKMFKLAGYRTLSMGKIFHTGERALSDAADVWSEPSWTRLNGLRRPRAFPMPMPRVAAWINSSNVPDETYADGVLSRLAAKLILEDLAPPTDNTTSRQPWFLAVGFYKPHLPFEAPKRYFDLAGNASDYPGAFNTGVIGNLLKAQSDVAKGSGCAEVATSGYANAPKNLGFPHNTATDTLQQANRGYHAAVMYMDAQLGIVLDALRMSSAKDNTIVVFLGDHGYHLGDHGLFCKHTNFEQATKVPLIIVPPLSNSTTNADESLSHPRGNTRSYAPVELLDLAPTLQEMAGLTNMVFLPKYRAYEGKSLVPILRNPSTAWVKPGAWSQYHRKLKSGGVIWGHSLRTTRYRITQWGAPFPFVEVYDYLTDAGETVSLHGDEQLKRRLLGEMAKAKRKNKRGDEAPFDFALRGDMANNVPP